MYQVTDGLSSTLNLLGIPPNNASISQENYFTNSNNTQQHLAGHTNLTPSQQTSTFALEAQSLTQSTPAAAPTPTCDILMQATLVDQSNQQQQLFGGRDTFESANFAPNFYRNGLSTQQQSTATNQQVDTAFTLDEIGAIINSKEFGLDLDPSRASHHHHHQQQQQQQQQRQAGVLHKSELPTPNAEKTKEQIYEHLKSLVAAEDDFLSQAQETMGPASKRPAAQAANGGGPFVEIVEQPAKCALRFRYKCEGRSAGSLPGVSSSADSKTYPAIRINNYVGRAVVVISCVTKEAPHSAHPHNLVGKEGCKKGICTIVIGQCEQQMVRAFSGLGIQCVKRKDIEESLTLRESINVDPFRQGFQHKLNTSNIDLNVVRLCFQVFIEGSTPNKCDVPLCPVVSDPIHDKKAMSDLVITKLSHCSAPATGGREVILLCDRIARDDVQIRFFEETRNGELVWETQMDISPADVHKQVAICFKSPKYYNENIREPVMARIQLVRLSDQQSSEPRPFQFLPCDSDEDMIQRKRQKIEWANMNYYATLDNMRQQQPSSSLGADAQRQLAPMQDQQAQGAAYQMQPRLTGHQHHLQQQQQQQHQHLQPQQQQQSHHLQNTQQVQQHQHQQQQQQQQQRRQ